jgi:ribose transport system substrate-binding protein
MNFRRVVMLGLAMIVVLAAGLAYAGTIPPGCKSKQLVTKSGKPYSQVTVALSEGAIDGVWRVKQVEWLKQDIEACGAKFMVTDGQGRGDKNLSDLEDLVAKKVDLIVVSTYFADEIVPGIQHANKSGIPVVVLSSDLGRGADFQTFITADNLQIAHAAADWVLKTHPNKEPINVIELIGREGSVAAKLRSEGFREKLKPPKVKWVANVTAHYMRAEAMRVMEDLLKANPKPGSIDVVYAANDEMALGAVLALKDARRLKEVKVMGIDGILCEVYDAVKKDEMAVTFFYPNFAPEGAEAVFKVLNGEPVEKKVIVPSTPIDKSNVDKFYPRCAK